MSLTSILPASGSTAGDTHVVLGGADFVEGMTVEFDGTPATDVVIDESGNSITCHTPAHAVGAVDVVVDPTGEAWTLTAAYTYTSVPTWVDIADYVEADVPSTWFPSGDAMVRCELWSTGGVEMQARLYDVTNSLSAGESIAVSSATPITADFSIFVSPGTNRYHLQVTSETPATDLFSAGMGLVPL